MNMPILYQLFSWGEGFFFSTYMYMLNFPTYILSLIGAEIIF